MCTMGRRLKKYREYLKLSQDDIAGLLGSSASYISLVENDRSKLSVENLIKLLLNYNINLNYLLAGVGIPFNIQATNNTQGNIIKELENIIQKYKKSALSGDF